MMEVLYRLRLLQLTQLKNEYRIGTRGEMVDAAGLSPVSPVE